MYTAIKSYQIIIALLKKYGIKHLVLSAGTRNVPFVHSVENDPDFICYSVVDERSAAYFAMGIAQEVNAPVVISCTSSTATTNYLPAITEAFYLGVPLLVLTSDRNPQYLGQLEDQMIEQVGMYGKVVRRSINLPVINDEDDFWYCERLVNEALLALSHRGKGPVQINIPTYKNLNDFSTPSLPVVKKIERYSNFDSPTYWQEKINELTDHKRILVVCGQTDCVSEELKRYIELFSEKFNCTIAIDHMSNLASNQFIHTSEITHRLKQNEFTELLPDLVISFNGNFISKFKELLRHRWKETKHWLINENGDLIDPFKCLSTIFESTPLYFFKYFVENAEPNIRNNGEYNNLWIEKIKTQPKMDIPYSNISVIKAFTQVIPDHSILHLSILNSIRITSFYKLPSKVKVYANLGSHGIDGCMSTFLGHATVSEKPSFLVIGDLSFFYDMNSIRIKHIKSNVRILLINNGGGAEFQRNFINNEEILSTINLHTAAKHATIAKAWTETVGFKYQTASNQKEYLSQLEEFIATKSDKPILFEIFTEMKSDSEILRANYSSVDSSLVGKSKNLVKSILGNGGAEKLKKVLGK